VHLGGGAENAGVQNAGVETAGVDKHTLFSQKNKDKSNDVTKGFSI